MHSLFVPRDPGKTPNGIQLDRMQLVSKACGFDLQWLTAVKGKRSKMVVSLSLLLRMSKRSAIDGEAVWTRERTSIVESDEYE